MKQKPIDRFTEIIDAIAAPLGLASKDNFSRLSNIKGLEVLLSGLIEEAIPRAPSPSVQAKLRALQNNFTGFGEATAQEQQERIRLGESLLAEMRKMLISRGADESDHHGDIARLLQTSIQYVKGVGPKISQLLKKKGIETIEDALYNLPIRYEDRREIRRVADLKVGDRCVGYAEVIAAGEVVYPKSRRRVYEAILGDDSGFITAKWFQGIKYIRGRLNKGDHVIFCGAVRGYRAQKEIHHPDLEWVEGVEEDSLHFGRIVPVYSETEGLYQRRIRGIMNQVVQNAALKVTSSIPQQMCERCNLMPLSEALCEVHFPQGYLDIERLNLKTSQPHQRLAFEEFFFLELGMALRRRGIAQEMGTSFQITNTPTVGRLLGKLPFTLTTAQERVVEEIKRDMTAPHPMNRLLQGDVGSGKTVVALIASLIAIDNGYQAAVMAPTEILAEQHYFNLREWLREFNIRVVLLTGRIKGKEREGLYRAIMEGEAQLIVGTHALIQEGLSFKQLGLCVVDEQHRFGVMQRARLKRKGTVPDLLVMTATPIPRTLAMTLYGDMEVSVLDELPPGRGPVVTKVFREREREEAYRMVDEAISQGRQAYVVYPLVEESENMDLRDATQGAQRLRRDVFSNYTVGLIHGRMKGDEKEQIMQAFRAGEIQILVATTVIEVGIDFPNATVMVVEHAERFGLSQLHQLRGRIGRGSYSSQCLLMASPRMGKEAWRRLKIMEQTTDGFRIAEEDLAIRGPGEFLGVRQWGLPDFRVANLIRDVRLLQLARQEAFALIDQDPQLSRGEHHPLRDIIQARWQKKLELAAVG
ncbi:MAG: ATP-dependent DNA helicase RecG [Deltaproteobacteria bacterium]|nr:ATP-dependent DNA helicase RecG [Deltaproteobacteria bacterium]